LQERNCLACDLLTNEVFQRHTRHHFDTEVPQRNIWHYFDKNASLFSFQRAFRLDDIKRRIGVDPLNYIMSTSENQEFFLKKLSFFNPLEKSSLSETQT
ncbi:hypothetical protein, partial [Brevibacillus borstelensis]|uniref:hypothetical protein n=1 Tax=Brevibacillus borstelensis TaxID=45462 RepID=UPI0030BFBF02